MKRKRNGEVGLKNNFQERPWLRRYKTRLPRNKDSKLSPRAREILDRIAKLRR